jgi:hypothetical protein
VTIPLSGGCGPVRHLNLASSAGKDETIGNDHES